MATRTVYRKADISSAEATKSLFAGFPGAELVSFVTKTASAAEAKAAGATEGDLVYEATVKMAEFPPSDDSSGSSDSGDDAPAPSKESEGGDDKSDSSDDSSSDSSSEDKGGDSKPDFGGDGGEEKEPKLKGDDGIIHLLTEILHALKGDAGLGAPGGDLGAGPDAGLGPDLPDVGAPAQGDTLPPPGGPAGAPGGAPPLPPPVKEKAPIGGAAFAHYNPEQAEFSVLRHDASELGNKAMIAEAAEIYPTHKVARIQRTGAATINNLNVDLPANNVAVVTLVRK